MPTIQTSILGASGEYLVLSLLLKNNFIAGKAPENTKDYDLIIINKDGTNSAPIQVKTSSHNTHWIMSEKHEIVINNLYFFFVYMGEELKDTEIFIIDSKTVAHALSFSHKIWGKLPGINGKKHKDNSMRKLSRDFSHIVRNTPNYRELLTKTEVEFINEYSEGWINQFKNAWHLLKSE